MSKSDIWESWVFPNIRRRMECWAMFSIAQHEEEGRYKRFCVNPCSSVDSTECTKIFSIKILNLDLCSLTFCTQITLLDIIKMASTPYISVSEKFRYIYICIYKYSSFPTSLKSPSLACTTIGYKQVMMLQIMLLGPPLWIRKN